MHTDKEGRLMTMKEKEFRRLFDKKTQGELARLLGISQPAVSYWAKKLGLSKGNLKRVDIQK